MAIAVLFMYNPKDDRTFTDVFQTPDNADPVRAAENLRSAIRDDFPAEAIWSIGMDDDARNIAVNNRMRDMGFPDYDHETAQS